MTFPFKDVLGYHYKCLVSRSVPRYIVHVLHRLSQLHVGQICHRNAVMERALYS